MLRAIIVTAIVFVLMNTAQIHCALAMTPGHVT